MKKYAARDSQKYDMKLRLLIEEEIPREEAVEYIDAVRGACRQIGIQHSRQMDQTALDTIFSMDTHVPPEKLQEAQRASLETPEDWLTYFGNVKFKARFVPKGFIPRSGSNNPADDWEDEFTESDVDITADIWLSLQKKELRDEYNQYRCYYKMRRVGVPPSPRGATQYVARNPMELYRQLKDLIHYNILF